MMQAELATGRQGRRAPEPARSAPARYPVSAAADNRAGSAIDKAWLEARFAGIAALCNSRWRTTIQPSRSRLSDQRLDQMEARLETRLGDVSARLGSDWLQVVEDHVKELSTQFEATSRQLARLDAIDGQLQQITRTLDEKRQSVADAATLGSGRGGHRGADRHRRPSGRSAGLAATLPAPEAERGHRIDALEGMMQDYIAERRRGEEIDLRHAAHHRGGADPHHRSDRCHRGAGAGAPTAAEKQPMSSGMDLEGARLAEAYAAGARVLGQKPGRADAGCGGLRPRPERRQEPALAGEPVAADRTQQTQTRRPRRSGTGSAGAAGLRHARQGQGPGRPRGDGCQQAPRSFAPMLPLAGDRPRQEPGGLRSRLLIGGAMALLFGAGYLAVDLLVARGAPAGEQQASRSQARRPERRRVAPAPASRARGAPSPSRRPGSPPSLRLRRRTRSGRFRCLSRPSAGRRRPPATPNQVSRALARRRRPGTWLACRSPSPCDSRPPSRQPSRRRTPPPWHCRTASSRAPRRRSMPLPTGIGSNALREAAVERRPDRPVRDRHALCRGQRRASGPEAGLRLVRARGHARPRVGPVPPRRLLERGVGVTADVERAKVWYRRAAEQGHVRAMHNLAVLVAGRGQEQADYAGAAHWFREAAERGLCRQPVQSRHALCERPRRAKDLPEAYKWFALAARCRRRGAARRLEEIKAQLDPPRDRGRRAASSRPGAPHGPEAPPRSGADRVGRAGCRRRRRTGRCSGRMRDWRTRFPFCALCLPRACNSPAHGVPIRSRESSRPLIGARAGRVPADPADRPISSVRVSPRT